MAAATIADRMTSPSLYTRELCGRQIEVMVTMSHTQCQMDRKFETETRFQIWLNYQVSKTA